jgi:D-glycero-D-manno-heptose 1,7-bisphosphate phosphatase|tara:strand:- start:1356 stop:1877 length:522 start_codon:yes stop_codon:yes gene_type:complete
VVKKPAIFFDRDGTLVKTNVKNNKPLAINNIDKLHIFKKSYKICNLLKEKYKIFIITNQPDVEKKKVKKKDVVFINNKIRKELDITKVYNCYCTSNSCKFRKPNSGMITKAAKEFNIDLKKSYMIGDRWKDISSGNKARCKTILIKRKYSEVAKCNPNYIVSNLGEILNIIKL